VYESILSGDLSGNDKDVNDPRKLETELTRRENSYNVVKSNKTNQTAVLDGFTITGGYGTSMPYRGGVYNIDGSPTFNNCCFRTNYASYGGGMYNYSSSPILTNCTFSNNYASDWGGGMYNYSSSSPILTNCTFSNNYASDWGGGMYNGSSSPILTNCTFSNNYASGTGGGMFNYSSSSPILTNCKFINNYAGYGGGMYNYSSSIPILNNCTLSNNYANYNGGGMYNRGTSSKPKLFNTIVWANVPNQFYGTAIANVSYSNIQGGWTGTGNIDSDPLFAAPGYWSDVNDPNIVVEPNDPNAIWIDGDYHLKSEVGRWDPASKTWVIDAVHSPCIDAGDPKSPVGLEPQPNGGRINMGAYGGTAEASKSQ
jgi:parallel beta-helix repeat protein